MTQSLLKQPEGLFSNNTKNTIAILTLRPNNLTASNLTKKSENINLYKDPLTNDHSSFIQIAKNYK